MGKKFSDSEISLFHRKAFQSQLNSLLPKPAVNKPEPPRPEYDYSQFPVQDVLNVDLSKKLDPETVGNLGMAFQEYGVPIGSKKVSNLAAAIQANKNLLTGFPESPSHAAIPATPKAIAQTLEGIINPKKPVATEPAVTPTLDEKSTARIGEIKNQAWLTAQNEVGKKMGMTSDLQPGDPKYDRWLADSTNLYKFIIAGYTNDDLQKYQPAKPATPEQQQGVAGDVGQTAGMQAASTVGPQQTADGLSYTIE